MDGRLGRERPGSTRPTKPGAQALWEHLSASG
jgi:hypothetical protein